MGQRLNIEIKQGGITLANAYYHWSAYTSSSLELTQLIIKDINQIKDKNPIIRAIRLLEKTGALLTSDEIEKIKKEHGNHFESATDRSEGLIAISEEGMDSTRRWEEGRVEIHLDDQFVNFNVFWLADKDTYLEDYEQTEEFYEKLPIKGFKYKHVPFSEFGQFSSEILKLIKSEVYGVRLKDGSVLSFIE